MNFEALVPNFTLFLEYRVISGTSETLQLFYPMELMEDFLEFHGVPPVTKWLKKVIRFQGCHHSRSTRTGS